MNTGSREETKKCPKLPHNLTLEGRKQLVVSGVTAVDNFDDKTIQAMTSMGELTIKGENLNIKKLCLEDLGDLEIEGKISSLSYSEKGQGSEGFFSKLFK